MNQRSLISPSQSGCGEERSLPAYAIDGSKDCTAYEEHKRAYQRAAQCEAQGIQFVTLVAEDNNGGWRPNGWRPSAICAWRSLASLISVRSGEPIDLVADQSRQSMNVALQRENARAVLRRLTAPLLYCQSRIPSLNLVRIPVYPIRLFRAHPRIEQDPAAYPCLRLGKSNAPAFLRLLGPSRM